MQLSMNEFEIYESLESPVDANGFDPLLWWNCAPPVLHRLRYFASKYLAIPSSSVASEEVFSAAGRTLTEFRSGLEPSTASTLLMLRCNRQYSSPSPLLLPSF